MLFAAPYERMRHEREVHILRMLASRGNRLSAKQRHGVSTVSTVSRQRLLTPGLRIAARRRDALPLVDCATAHPNHIFQKCFVGEYGAESG